MIFFYKKYLNLSIHVIPWLMQSKLKPKIIFPIGLTTDLSRNNLSNSLAVGTWVFLSLKWFLAPMPIIARSNNVLKHGPQNMPPKHGRRKVKPPISLEIPLSTSKGHSPWNCFWEGEPPHKIPPPSLYVLPFLNQIFSLIMEWHNLRSNSIPKTIISDNFLTWRYKGWPSTTSLVIV